MYRDVLVPVDLTERVAEAFAAVAQVAAPGAHVELLHVVERLVEDPDPEFQSFYQALERRAQEQLETWRDELAQQGYAAQAQVRVGRLGAEILQRAQAGQCDVIVMSSHAIQGPDGRLGTLSHQVAMLAPCPVLLVRGSARDR